MSEFMQRLLRTNIGEPVTVWFQGDVSFHGLLMAYDDFGIVLDETYEPWDRKVIP